MGAPMARHLSGAGHTLSLFNRSRIKCETWIEANGAADATIAASPAEAAKDATVVICCVGNDDDLADVIMGRDGIFQTLGKDALLIDHTTVSAKVARQISVEGKSKQVHCVDAPVSGGQAGAETGRLSIMCGGTEAAMNLARPIMKPYAARIVHVGGPGAGQQTKMANQIAIAGILGGLSEAMRFAQASNLDSDKVFEAISGGAAQSWQMDNRWHSMARDEFDFGFAIDWMRKDLGLALEEARSVGSSAPVAAMIDQFYAEVQTMGAGRQDTSALVRRMRSKGKPA